MLKRGKKHKTFREIIQFYLIDINTTTGKLIDVFIILLNLLICLMFVLETYPISPTTSNFLWNVELIVVGLFIIEYIARFYGAPNRFKYVIDVYSIIDFIAILPTIILLLMPTTPIYIGFIKLIRVFRVLRIFRFLRFMADPHFFFGNVTLHLLKVIRLALTIIIIFFVSSGFFWLIESPANPRVSTFGDAFYFSVVTLTTVGFGDILPLSTGGRWVVVLMILSGIALIPWQISRIMKEWLYLSTKRMITCKRCGLKHHDKDASHCKHCGRVIYQEYEG